MTELEFKLVLNQKLCDLMDVLIYYYNPCQIKDGSCLRMRTIQDEHKFCCGFYAPRGEKDCDRKCMFLQEDGSCRFRNIKCKLWFCETAIRSAPPELIQAIKILEEFTKLYKLTRRPFLGEGYVGRSKEVSVLNNQQSDKSSS